jgi:hypothetical protein
MSHHIYGEHFIFLIVTEILVLFSDIALTTSLYLKLYLARRIFFTFIYVIKLLIEFLVLNRLVKVGRLRQEQARDLGGESNGGVILSDARHTYTPLEQVKNLLSLRFGSNRHHTDSVDAMPPISIVESEKNLSHSLEESISSMSSPSCTASEAQQEKRSSMDKFERKYLGRFGTELEV